MVAIGRHDNVLAMVPYEEEENLLMPITIHAIRRQQINFRLKNGRFIHE